MMARDQQTHVQQKTGSGMMFMRTSYLGKFVRVLAMALLMAGMLLGGVGCGGGGV